MNAQAIINKLKMAFFSKGIIIKISVEERYSLSYHRTFKKYKVVETTETELEMKKEYYDLKKEYKNRGEPLELKILLEEKKRELAKIKKLPKEFSNRIDIVKYLSEKYKELVK